jgi:DNA mismatch repair ATPase MutL
MFRVEDFGLDLIEVKDNGTGVRKSDLELMTAPFSTSKISSFEDLVIKSKL